MIYQQTRRPLAGGSSTMRKTNLALLLLAGLGLGACGYSTGDRAVSGGLLGAGAGAGVSALTGGSVGTGALIGGAARAALSGRVRGPRLRRSARTVRVASPRA